MLVKRRTIKETEEVKKKMPQMQNRRGGIPHIHWTSGPRCCPKTFGQLPPSSRRVGRSKASGLFHRNQTLAEDLLDSPSLVPPVTSNRKETERLMYK